MGRRPTIQTTVTASLTKSSLVACNQMLPVKFASKLDVGIVCCLLTLSLLFIKGKKRNQLKDGPT